MHSEAGAPKASPGHLFIYWPFTGTGVLLFADSVGPAEEVEVRATRAFCWAECLINPDVISPSSHYSSDHGAYNPWIEKM